MICSLLTKKKYVLILNSLLLITIYVPCLMGWIEPLESRIASIMDIRPLSIYYFLFFLLAGVLLPLSVRISHNKKAIVQEILDPYLLLLAGQIISEIILVYVVGKGMGVIVGFTFTSLRIFQVKKLLTLARDFIQIKRLLKLQSLIWSINLIQITFNRFIFIHTV